MNELNSLDWDKYLSPPKSTKPPSLRKNDTSLSEGSQALVESPHGSQRQDYSGFVFKDISQELHLESKYEINEQKNEIQPEQTSHQEEQDPEKNDRLVGTGNDDLENDERKDDKDEDALSDEGSNEPVLSGENNEDDEFDLDSPDSLSTKESFNDQEILAHNNAIKNKDILHESFLQEFRPENDQSPPQQPQHPPQNASHSVEGDTKSVTFADEDSIYEFEDNNGGDDGNGDDRPRHFHDQPLDMDPNSIPTTDREEVTRRYMMEAVREEAHRSALKINSSQQQQQSYSEEMCFPEDDSVTSQQQQLQQQEMLLLNHSTNEELEHQFAREKFEELLLTSPEFRAAILAYQTNTSILPSPLKPKKGLSTRVTPPEPRSSKAPQQMIHGQAATKKKNLHVKPYSESSVADSFDSSSNVIPLSSRNDNRNGRPTSAPPSLLRKTAPVTAAALNAGVGHHPNLPKLPRALRKNNATLPSLPQRETPLSNNDLQQNETILLSKTANLEHIYRLAQDPLRPSPSVEFAPLPPKLSTDCPMLPFDGIMKLAELNLIGDSPLIELHPEEQKLRLKLKYFASLSDWEFSNRLDFFGLHFFRSEYFIPSPSSSAASLTGAAAGGGGAAAPSKKKLLLSQETIKDLLFANRTKDLRKHFPHLFQFNSFIKATYTGFVCLVFDMKLQLLGTYDHKSKAFFPGLTICPPAPQAPPFASAVAATATAARKQRKKRSSLDTSVANLFEIDLNSLPLETFAIIPVLYDDTPQGAQFPEMNFQFDLSVTEATNRVIDEERETTSGASTARGSDQCGGGGSSGVGIRLQRKRPYWLPSSSDSGMGMDNELDQRSEATPIHDLFEIEREDRANDKAIATPAHVIDLEAGWTHAESFFCHRPTMIPPDQEDLDALEGPPPLRIEKMETQSKMATFGAKQSYAPFVIFRRLTPSVTPTADTAATGEASEATGGGQSKRLWGIKSLQESFSGIMFHAVVRGVLESLKRKHILPYHIVNVEHCRRCHLHSMTTWHVPGSYEKWFMDLKRILRRALPPAIITSNKFSSKPKQPPPRVGSFELSIRPYCSDLTQLIFSKLSSRTLPPTETILRDLAILLFPETIQFKGSHILELHVMNSYSRRPVHGAVISLYQVSVEMTLTDDIERNGLKEMRDDFILPDDDEEDEEEGQGGGGGRGGGRGGTRGGTEVKRNRHKIRIENAKRNSQVNQARAAAAASTTHTHNAKHSTHVHTATPVDYSTQLATGSDAISANFRHSSVYFKVRSWKVEDVTAWFRSFSISKEIISRALADGLVDGPSFLALANQTSFERWGIRNKIKLERMNRSLEEIFQTNTSQDIATATQQLQHTQQLEQTQQTSTSGATSDLMNGLTSGGLPLSLTEIKQCHPGKPKPKSQQEDLTLKLISRKQTDSHGLGFISLDTAGTYFFRIESSVTAPYCSNAFQISGKGHTGYCAAMTPRIGTAHITIRLDEEAEDLDQDHHAVTGILISMMNLLSGKRHIAFAKRKSEKIITEPSSVTAPASSASAPASSAPATSASADASSAAVSLGRPPPKRSLTIDGSPRPLTSSPRPMPKPSRQNSVGSILLNEMTSSWRGRGSILVSKRPSPSTPAIPEGGAERGVERETRVLEAVIWLPVGKYFSEVNGEVFEVTEKKDSDSLTKLKQIGKKTNNYWSSPEHDQEQQELEQEQEQEQQEEKGDKPLELSYAMTQAQRCHRRILLGSVRAFQKIYRRYKKDFLTTNLWAYLALKRHLRRYLEYVRVVIAQKKASMIGSMFRMHAARRVYLHSISCVVRLQSVIRRFLARRRAAVKRRSWLFVLRVITRYAIRWRVIRERKVKVVQCFYRQHLARVRRNRQLVNRRMFKALKRWLRGNEKMRRHLEEREREEKEREKMSEVEERQREEMKRIEREEKRKLREKLFQVERKRNGMAMIIQRNYRRHLCQERYRILSRGVAKLQRICRLQIYEDRVKKGRQQQGQGQGLVPKYVIGFPMLTKHPQLLGGTKLLLGLSLAPRPPSPPKYIDQILLKLTTPPAIKIQSIARMYLVRLWYISQWRAQRLPSDGDSDGNLNESLWPPLYRTLVTPIQSSNSDDDEVTHGSDPDRRDWDNGAQTLLNELGYYRSPSKAARSSGDGFGDDYGDEDEGDYGEGEEEEDGEEEEGLGPLEFRSSPQAPRPSASLSVPPSVSPTPRDRASSAATSASGVRSARNSFHPQQIHARDRRITRVEDQRLRHASAIRIQSLLRRYLARQVCAQKRAEKEEKQLQQQEREKEQREQEANSNAKSRLLSVMKTQSSMLQSLKSFSLSDNLRSFSRSLSSPASPGSPSASSSSPQRQTSRPLLRVLSKEFVHAVDQSVRTMKATGDSVVTRYQEKTEQLKESKEKAKLEMLRKQRLQANEFCVEDAVFNVRGRVTDLPRLNRLWYLGVFPQLDEWEIDEETAADKEMLSGHDLEQAYEMLHDRLIGEAVRTPPLTPFSKETYHKLNFNLHLAHLQRYTRLLIVLFVETSEELDGRIRSDVLPNHIAIPSVKKRGKGAAGTGTGIGIGTTLLTPEIPHFLPLFYGSCQLNGGLAFPPTGGRLLFHLQPNPNQAIIFSKSQAKRLSAIKHIELQGTLIPIAIPSSSFLSSLTPHPQASSAVLPYYPGELLEAFLFEKNEVHVKEFYGAAVCMLRFSDRNLLSTRHRGVPNGVVEFSTDGRYLGKVIEYREDLGTISTMARGKYHFICCGSTGAIAIYAPKESTLVQQQQQSSLMEPSLASVAASVTSPTSAVASVVDATAEPFELIRFQALHQWPILLSCCIHRAGLDFFFTIDRQNALGVIIMDHHSSSSAPSSSSSCLRSYLNPPLVATTATKITCCQAIRDRLYLGLQNGCLLTINIAPLLNGQLDCGKRLQEYVLDREAIYSEDCGISTMAVMSSAEYFGMLHEDLDHHLFQPTTAGAGAGATRGFTSTNVRIKPRPQLIGMKLRAGAGGAARGETGEDESIFRKNSRLKPGRPLEGHILIIAGGDSNPTIKILHPSHPKPATGSAFDQLAELPGHGKAATHIVCDVAGRFIVTASQGSKSIAVWNGVTFNCERTHENVNVGYLGAGDNALFACSFRAPFVTIWRPPEDPLQLQRQAQLKRRRAKRFKERGTGGGKRRLVESSRSNLSDLFNLSSVLEGEGQGLDSEEYPEGEAAEETEEEEQEPDGRPEIAMVRTSVWCLTTVTGGKIIPQKSLSATAHQYLGDNGRRVVTDWRSCYDRSIKKIAKAAPPMRSQSQSPSLKKSSSLPPIQEKKAKRKELQRLASGATGGPGRGGGSGGDSVSSWNRGGGAGDGDEEEGEGEGNESLSQPTFDTSPAEEGAASTSKGEAGAGAGYDYERGCYYDESGYAYNYDQQGNYFYYDAAWYDQHFPAATAIATPAPVPSATASASPSPLRHSRDEEELALGMGIGSTMTSDSFPEAFPSQEELHIGEYSFQSPRLSQEQRQQQLRGVGGQQEQEPKSVAAASKKIFHQDPQDYDRYGKYIGSDLDRYDDDIPPLSAFSSSLHRSGGGTAGGTGGGGSKHSLPVISLRRRHMHMSDSESDEEEKLESIFRKKNKRSAQRQQNRVGRSKTREEEMPEEEVEERNFGRGGIEPNPEEDQEGEREEGVAETKYLEREKYIQRGLLHHLADDSEEEDN